MYLGRCFQEKDETRDYIVHNQKEKIGTFLPLRSQMLINSSSGAKQIHVYCFTIIRPLFSVLGKKSLMFRKVEKLFIKSYICACFLIKDGKNIYT